MAPDKTDLSKVNDWVLNSQLNKLYERKEKCSTRSESQDLDNRIKDILVELVKREVGKRQGS